MSNVRKYTAADPLVLCQPRHESRSFAVIVAEHFVEHGGIQVWHDLVIGRPPRVWVLELSSEDKPHWAAGDPIRITDPLAVVVRTWMPPQTVERTYLDLGLFERCIARLDYDARLVGLRDKHASLSINDFGIELGEYDTIEEYLDSMDAPQSVTVRWSRQAHNPNGFLLGYETYLLTFPLVVRENDVFRGPGKPTGLAQWLVRVDNEAVQVELIDAPEDETLDPVDEGDEDMDDVSLYYRPDDDFVWQEGDRIREAILDVGAQRRFYPEATAQQLALRGDPTPIWDVVDAYEFVLDD